MDFLYHHLQGFVVDLEIFAGQSTCAFGHVYVIMEMASRMQLIIVPTRPTPKPPNVLFGQKPIASGAKKEDYYEH